MFETSWKECFKNQFEPILALTFRDLKTKLLKKKHEIIERFYLSNEDKTICICKHFQYIQLEC